MSVDCCVTAGDGWRVCLCVTCVRSWVMVSLPEAGEVSCGVNARAPGSEEGLSPWREVVDGSYVVS